MISVYCNLSWTESVAGSCSVWGARYVATWMGCRGSECAAGDLPQTKSAIGGFRGVWLRHLAYRSQIQRRRRTTKKGGKLIVFQGKERRLAALRRGGRGGQTTAPTVGAHRAWAAHFARVASRLKPRMPRSVRISLQSYPSSSSMTDGPTVYFLFYWQVDPQSIFFSIFFSLIKKLSNSPQDTAKTPGGHTPIIDMTITCPVLRIRLITRSPGLCWTHGCKRRLWPYSQLLPFILPCICMTRHGSWASELHLLFCFFATEWHDDVTIHRSIDRTVRVTCQVEITSISLKKKK